MRSKATALAIHRQQKIFWALIATIVLLFALYGYFVSKSITNVLIREEIEQTILSVNSEISEMEFDYLKKKDQISLVYAYEHGYVDLASKEFVTRKSVLGSRVVIEDTL